MLLFISALVGFVGNNTERGGVNQHYHINKAFSFPYSDSYMLLPQLLMIQLVDP